MASTAAALPFLPVPPQAEVMSRAGSPEALQITFRSKSTPGEVLNYYRVILPNSGWSLESDAEDAVGAAALYALKDGHPMWIRISQSPRDAGDDRGGERRRGGVRLCGRCRARRSGRQPGRQLRRPQAP